MDTMTSASETMPFSNAGQKRVKAALDLQNDLLNDYAQASRAWLERMQSEVALWAAFGSKLTATRSVPEALEAYTKCVSQQMKMTAEDGQHLFHDWQHITQKVTKSFGNGWPRAIHEAMPMLARN
jgi:ribosomal protein L16 Arg81 hydroxylase